MECCFLVTIGLLLFLLVQFVKLLRGKGPGNIRRLLQPDIAAFMVLTAGVALAFAIIRLEPDPTAAACVLVVVLPITIAAVWFGRHLVEDISELFGKRRKRASKQIDLEFLQHSAAKEDGTGDDMVQADLVEQQPTGLPHEPPDDSPNP